MKSPYFILECFSNSRNYILVEQTNLRLVIMFGSESYTTPEKDNMPLNPKEGNITRNTWTN